MASERIDFLDAMRGLAAFAVVWNHYTTIFPTCHPDLYDNMLSFLRTKIL
ncbi:MAG: hypothetical protein LBV72_10980 [Tannerella sp.]|jgi:peptidoglycan/LPS O-acetylase OafA/YrhL|nr:hypothetical protein [Tannerella sp.]